jgi:hypothetical protein
MVVLCGVCVFVCDMIIPAIGIIIEGGAVEL